MKLPCKFQLGARVYHRCDPDAGRGMVLRIAFAANGGITYSVVWDTEKESEHYEIELTSVREWNQDDSEESGDGPKQSATENK